MARWRDVVREEIRLRVARGGSATFTRADLIDQSAARFRSAFPAAQTPEQTLSRVLQELRDLGELEFVRPGVYTLTASGTPEETAQREIDLARPPVHPGERVVRLAPLASRPFQRPFRSYVLPNFDNACGVCGLTPEWFLHAAHLQPVTRRPDLAGDPSAGVALCHNHHQALDAGALVIEKDLTLRVRAADLPRDVPELERVLLRYDGALLRPPTRFALNPAALPGVGARAG